MTERQNGGTIRAFLVDDHPVILGGLRDALRRCPEIEVAGTARTGRDAVAQVLSLEPDVVVLDMQLPDLSGTEVLRRIKAGAPRVAVVLFTAFANPDYLLDAVAGGAADFLLKDREEDDILDRVCRVAAGEMCLTPEVWRDLYAKLNKVVERQPGAPPIDLSERDRLILRAFARGATNGQMERILGVGPDTVRYHIKNLFKRMNTSDRTQAVVTALKWGLLSLDEV